MASSQRSVLAIRRAWRAGVAAISRATGSPPALPVRFAAPGQPLVRSPQP